MITAADAERSKAYFAEEAEKRLHLAKGRGVKGVANVPQVKARLNLSYAWGAQSEHPKRTQLGYVEIAHFDPFRDEVEPNRGPTLGSR